MAEVKPSFKLPFTQFPGLPAEDARRIWRDFDAVAASLVPAPTIFDAIIDPTLAASSPSTHAYKNLTDLVANETWAAHTMFNVGVMQDGLTPIVEPSSPINISTKGDISLFGIDNYLTDASHTAWDWGALTCAATQQVFAYNLTLGSTGTSF